MATIGSTRRSLLIAAMVAAAFLAQLAAGQTLSARSSSASSRFAVEESDDDDTVVASRPTAGADDDDSIDGRRASYSSKNKNKYTSTYNNKNTKKTDKKKDCVRFAGSCYYDSDCCDSDLRCHDRKCLRGCSQEAGFCQSDIDCCSTDEHPLACNKTSSVCVKRSDCNRFNETCASDGDCCDSKLVCDKNRCLKGCNEKEDACKSDADCCSTALNPLSCDMTTHKCVDEPMCLMFGAACDENPVAGENKCCEPLWCDSAPAGGDSFCLNGCSFDGDCKSDADCCSTDAAPLACIRDTNKCGARPECTRFNEECQDDKDCCDSTLKCLEVMGEHGVKLDGASYERSVAGGAAASSGGDVSTYARGSSPPAAGGRSLLYAQSGTIKKCLRGCNMVDGMCFSNFDCCSDTENTLVCNNATNMCEVDERCSTVAGMCTDDMDCCEPLECKGNKCFASCVEPYGYCMSNADCCSNSTDWNVCHEGMCVPETRQCNTTAEMCTDDKDCCEPLSCQSGFCLKSCSVLSGKCMSDADCCSTKEDPLVCSEGNCIVDPHANAGKLPTCSKLTILGTAGSSAGLVSAPCTDPLFTDVQKLTCCEGTICSTKNLNALPTVDAHIITGNNTTECSAAYTANDVNENFSKRFIDSKGGARSFHVPSNQCCIPGQDGFSITSLLCEGDTCNVGDVNTRTVKIDDFEICNVNQDVINRAACLCCTGYIRLVSDGGCPGANHDFTVHCALNPVTEEEAMSRTGTQVGGECPVDCTPANKELTDPCNTDDNAHCCSGTSCERKNGVEANRGKCCIATGGDCDYSGLDDMGRNGNPDPLCCSGTCAGGMCT